MAVILATSIGLPDQEPAVGFISAMIKKVFFGNFVRLRRRVGPEYVRDPQDGNWI